MSITLNNGVVLPGIPTAYTGEEFIASAPDPSTLKYHAILPFVNNGDLIYYLLFSSDVPLSHVSSYMMFVPMAIDSIDLSGISNNWTTHMIAEADDYSDAVWLEGACGTLGDDPIISSSAFIPVWSDYDIGTITEVDPENETVTWGTEIYFPNSLADPVPEIMSVTGEWLVSMAGHTRRLSGTSDKFTPEQMDEFYGALEIPEAGEVTLQEKSVDPSTEAQEIVADSGFDGLSKVSVGAVALREETATPTNADFVVTPGDGYIGLSKVTVKAAPTQGIIIVPSTEQQLIKPSGDVVGYSQISVMPPSMEKLTVTPTTEEQVFTPTTGYVGFSTVTVKAAESGGGGVEYPNVMEVSF